MRCPCVLGPRFSARPANRIVQPALTHIPVQEHQPLTGGSLCLPNYASPRPLLPCRFPDSQGLPCHHWHCHHCPQDLCSRHVCSEGEQAAQERGHVQI